MKNKGNILIIFLILIALVVTYIYYDIYHSRYCCAQPPLPEKVDTIATSTISTTTDVIENKNTLHDSEFTKTSKDPQAKILAKGDVNNDGYQDAIIQEVFCGASCAVQLKVVLNNKNINATLMNDTTFVPAYNSSGAAKSDVTNVTIKDGIISLTGSGLDCANYQKEEPCTQEKWSIVKTVKYKFDGKKVIQLSVVSVGEKNNTAVLLKQCPTFKVVNQMPTTVPNNNPPSTYFILNGERREVAEFDLSWVSGNCTVETKVVY